jgi:hypothetical protein
MLDKDGNFLKCLACGKPVDYQGHHIKSQKMGGSDEPRNKLPICGYCHTVGQGAIHIIGTNSFVQKHPRVKAFFLRHGWQQSPITEKWFHPEEEKIRKYGDISIEDLRKKI